MKILYTFAVLGVLAACSSEPDSIILATPQTGDMFSLSSELFDTTSQAVKSLVEDEDDVVLKRADSGCSAEKATTLASQILKLDTEPLLILGPLCYSAFNAAQARLEKSNIPIIPLVAAKNWNQQMNDEAQLIADFTNEKMQSNDTVIAYVADDYGNQMAENLRPMLQGETRLFPLSHIKQTVEEEVLELASMRSSVIILAAQYEKAVDVVSLLTAFGSNAILVMTGATLPIRIVQDIGPHRMYGARFPVSVQDISEVETSPLGGALTHRLRQLKWLFQQDDIDEDTLANLPPSPEMRMVRINRDQSFAFDLGLVAPGS